MIAVEQTASPLRFSPPLRPGRAYRAEYQFGEVEEIVTVEVRTCGSSSVGIADADGDVIFDDLVGWDGDFRVYSYHPTHDEARLALLRMMRRESEWHRCQSLLMDAHISKIASGGPAPGQH